MASFNPSFYETFLQKLQKEIPSLTTTDTLRSLVHENLISSSAVEIPAVVRDQAQSLIAALFQLRQDRRYIDYFSNSLSHLGIVDPGNKSILMSYDFHIDFSSSSEPTLKLIEVNTNAAFLAMSDVLYSAHEMTPPILPNASTNLRNDILTELSLSKRQKRENIRIAIIDEKPEEQRLYIEFLLYKSLFERWGWNCSILDVNECDPTQFDFIYNRFTDFYLQNARHLLGAFQKKSVTISPNPFEYFLLADKERMLAWHSTDLRNLISDKPEIWKVVDKNVPRCFKLDQSTADHAWSNRKKLFFKPMRAFGSKQTYKGASISRKVFDDLLSSEGIIAQEYISAPETQIAIPTGDQTFKYDLRVYAYQDRAESMVARLYQGQVTNSKTQYGGFAAVKIY